MSPTTYIYDPIESLFSISDLNRLFDAAWDARTSSAKCPTQHGEDAASTTGALRPRMDVHESNEKDEITASFELPGMKKEDVSIDIQNNRLTVSGQSTVSSTLDQEGYAVRERRFGKFSRTIPLPSGIKAEDIMASIDDGVLTIRFPKFHPDLAPKKITIS